MSERVIINEKDNVGITLDGEGEIPAGHKFALKDIPKGEYVVKYGEIIGRASQDIKAGEWVHTHNVKSHLNESVEYSYNFHAEVPKSSKQTFMGFKRKQGRAGIRNEIYIIPTVGCVNDVCRRLEKKAQALVTGSIDGIFALTHQFGCSQLGEDNENIKKLLCGIAKNPNATYVLMIGLGCENNGLDGIKEELKDRENIAFFNCQEVEDEIEYGYAILKDFADKAKDLKREEVDFSELCIGLKCGGSDGYSGLTANPLVGKVSDRTVGAGGSAVLTAEEMVKEAHKMVEALGKNTYIKVPTIPEGLKAMKALKAEGFNVTATAIYTPMQAYLAAKAGADYAAPYVNRIDNLGANGIESTKMIQNIFENNGFTTQILAASFKNSNQVQELCAYGIGAATVAPDVIEGLIKNACVDAAVADFVRDFEKLCGEGKTMLNCAE